MINKLFGTNNIKSGKILRTSNVSVTKIWQKYWQKTEKMIIYSYATKKV